MIPLLLALLVAFIATAAAKGMYMLSLIAVVVMGIIILDHYFPEE